MLRRCRRGSGGGGESGGDEVLQLERDGSLLVV